MIYRKLLCKPKLAPILAVMVLFVGTIVPTIGHQANGQFRLQLNKERRSFVSGEMMYLEYFIENIGRAPIEMSLVSLLESNLVQVADSRGRVVPCRPMLGSEPKSATIAIPVGGKKRLFASLLRCGNSGAATGVVYDLLPGTYIVCLKLMGTTSDTLELTVTKRSREEENVRDLLQREVVLFKSQSSGIAACRDIISRYPKSVFIPNVYVELVTFMYREPGPRGTDDLLAVTREYVDRFPSFPGIRLAVNYHRVGLEREMKQGAKNLTPEQTSKVASSLRKWKQNYPRSLAAEFIDEELFRLGE